MLKNISPSRLSNTNPIKYSIPYKGATNRLAKFDRDDANASIPGSAPNIEIVNTTTTSTTTSTTTVASTTTTTTTAAPTTTTSTTSTTTTAAPGTTTTSTTTSTTTVAPTTTTTSTTTSTTTVAPTTTTTSTTTSTTTAAPTVFTVTNNVSSNYIINGGSNPTLSVTEGQTYIFNINASGHPFWIKTTPVTGTGNAYNSGVTNNGIDNGTITFVVPYDAPSTLYYICQFHSGMVGTINVTNV